MTDKNKPDQKEEAEVQNEDAVVKPDPETLHTSDPQENMKGPISSLVQSVKETVDENAEKDKEAAEKKRDEE